MKQLDKKLYLASDDKLVQDIRDIIIENSCVVKENAWDMQSIEIRSVYDTYRIINMIDKFLNKDK